MNFSIVLWQRLKHQLSKRSIPQELQVPIEGNPTNNHKKGAFKFLKNGRGSRRLRVYLRKSHQRGHAYQPRFSYPQILLSWLGSFVGIAILAYLSAYSPYPLIAAPMGATAVLVLGVPDSPLAQPRNVVGGNCWGAFVAIVCVQLFGTAPWVMALAVATTIKLMKLTRTIHPPSGAVALIGVMSGVSWHFFFTPVFAGSIIIVLWTVVFNNLVPGRTYPKHWL
ncbi:HPP family protein [Tumidithrix elongata RA019]|uniref:HPP family protein n=1 Tax=Tumidithrix elongata BACA0141 TaxID=2716417 RepID=A0AAW9Q932_9CYAN|nr:HPP family protein [Tumidithrix elongata RA019]